MYHHACSEVSIELYHPIDWKMPPSIDYRTHGRTKRMAAELLTDRLRAHSQGKKRMGWNRSAGRMVPCSRLLAVPLPAPQWQQQSRRRAKLATYPAATSTEALLFCLASPQMLSVLTEFNIPSEATITLKHEIALSTPPSSSSNEYPHQLSRSGVISSSHIQY